MSPLTSSADWMDVSWSVDGVTQVDTRHPSCPTEGTHLKCMLLTTCVTKGRHRLLAGLQVSRMITAYSMQLP